MNNVIDAYLNLAKSFSRHSHSLYLVGGAVRDVLLKQDFKDLDMVSDATPNEINSFLDNVDMTYAKYGAVKYKIGDDTFDIVTLRKEKGYKDYRHPETIQYVKKLNEDAKRRDFTINALYMDSKLKIYDYYNGQKDLEDKMIRTIGKAKKRIIEDPLRILRAIRFAIDLNFNIDKSLSKAMKKYAHLVPYLSLDKINAEISKIEGIDKPITKELFEYYNLSAFLNNYLNKPGKNPLISIITPLYNAEKYIKETAMSVVNQTYKNFEWIVVDDCSKDSSVTLLEEVNDKRIKIIKLEKNAGTANARNVALEQASGRYVTFLDSDDLLDKDYLKNQLAFIKANGFVISCGYYRKANNTNTTFFVPKTVSYQDIIKGNPLSCLTTMYDFLLFNDLRFPLNTTRHEDLVFWSDMLKRNVVARGNKEVLASYRIYEGSRNKSKRKLLLPLYHVFRNNFRFGILKSLYHVYCFVMYSLKKYRNVK